MGNSCLAEHKSEVGCVITQYGNFTVPLTDHETSLLRESWVIIKPNWNRIMCCVYSSLFKQYPDVGEVFKFTKDTAFPNAFSAQSMEIHTERFITFIEAIIQSKKDIEKITIDSGKLHHTYGARQNYVAALAVFLKHEVCEFLSQDGPGFSTCQIENAWDSLFQYIAGLLKFGIREGINEDKKKAERNVETIIPNV